MKTALIMIAFAAMLIVSEGCNEEICKPTAWLMSGSNLDAVDNEIIGRVGIRNNDNIEFGAESNWLGVKGENQTFGGYVVAWLPIDPNNFEPYVGFDVTAGDVADGSFYGFLAGTAIRIGPIKSVVEYSNTQYSGQLADKYDHANDEHRVRAGLIFEF